MEKIFYIVCLLVLCTSATAQNVGIGTTTPTSKLTVVSGGVGIEHNDGTISIKSTVGFGIGMFGTYSNHPFNLTANNTAGQLVIMPTGIIGIGNSNPTLAGLIVDKKAGAVNAMFGSDTTGVALESNWPGVGFNSYWNGTRKYMANGFGGVIGFNPTNGYFTMAGTKVIGTANAAATTTDILTATNTGNVGIGTSTPSAKLEVNGTFKLTDGTQGADKMLISDANGNASWKQAAFGTTERFAFGFSQSGLSAPTITKAYSLGSSTASGKSLELDIICPVAGLYHFNVNVASTNFNNTGDPLEIFTTDVNNLGWIVQDEFAPFLKTAVANVTKASMVKTVELYMSAGGVFSIKLVIGLSNSASTDPSSTNSKIYVSGHLIAP